MRRTWMTIGTAALLAVGCSNRVETRGQESAEIRSAGSETGSSAGNFARGAGRTVGHGAEGVGRAVHGTGTAAVYGAQELGQELSGTDDNPAAEARSEQTRRDMDRRFGRSGEHFEDSGRGAVQAGRGAGGTVVHGAETVWQTGEAGSGEIRRSTGERPSPTPNPGSSYGGGPRK